MRLYHLALSICLAAFSVMLISGCSAPVATQPAISVNITADGQSVPVELLPGSSVEQALKKADLALNDLDKVDPPLYSLVSDGDQISVENATELLTLDLSPDERGEIIARSPRCPSRPLRIGFHPGCKPGWEFKRWDPARFAGLADQLIDTQNAEVFWFGDASEKELVQSIMERMKRSSRSVAGVLSIRDAAALMSTCNLFVSNDSGPMHLAAAVGVPTVALFSSNNPRANPARTGPLGGRHTILQKPNLQDITVAEVAVAAMAAITPEKEKAR